MVRPAITRRGVVLTIQAAVVVVRWRGEVVGWVRPGYGRRGRAQGARRACWGLIWVKECLAATRERARQAHGHPV